MKFEDIEIEDVDFEAMLEESFKKSESKSDLVTGTVVKIDEKDNISVIDIGGGRDATLTLDELRDEEGNLAFKVGDTIDVVNLGRGRISHKAALSRVALNEFIAEYDEDQEYIIEGVITKTNKGGYVVDCDGLEFFMPRTLSYLSSKVDPTGKKVKAVIVKVDKEKGSVVVSRKELIERDKAKTDEIVAELLENKEPVVGTIKKITSYGMFVDVGGVDGLVHYNEISYKGPVNPSKLYKEGDVVTVKAISYDKDKRHLSLSIKAVQSDPWAEVESELDEGDTITVTVSNIEAYGVFVDLGNDIEGFLHISEISWNKNVKNPNDYLTVGEEIDVEVIEINSKTHKLRVSLKRLLPKPFDEFMKNYNEGDIVTGTITSLTDFGAFVRISGVEGLLHNQDISWDKNTKAKETLTSGDEIEVKIAKINSEDQKISLNRKTLLESPIDKFATTNKLNSIVTGTIRDIKDFGVFVSSAYSATSVRIFCLSLSCDRVELSYNTGFIVLPFNFFY